MREPVRKSDERIQLNPSSVARVLSAIAAFFILASFAGQLSTYWLGRGRLYGLVELFNVDTELVTIFQQFSISPG